MLLKEACDSGLTGSLHLGTVLRTLSVCFQPILPNNAVCELCNKGDGATSSSSGTTEEQLENQIMECRICFEIQHPSCLKQSCPEISHSGVIDEDLPSSWECARCCEEGKEGQGKVRNILYVIHSCIQLFALSFIATNKDIRLSCTKCVWEANGGTRKDQGSN